VRPELPDISRQTHALISCVDLGRLKIDHVEITRADLIAAGTTTPPAYPAEQSPPRIKAPSKKGPEQKGPEVDSLGAFMLGA
jgi:hypothetical protein